MPAGPSSSADGGDSESDATATVTASRGLQHQRSGTLRQRPSGTTPPPLLLFTLRVFVKTHTFKHQHAGR